MNYDVIIVGAGIAGLYAGWKLASGGRSVCILDRRKEIGLPVRCGEATGSRAELARFIEIDESWIARDISGIAIHVNRSFSVDQKVPEAGVILHRERFEQDLAKRARESGVRILLETSVADLCMETDRCSGVKVEDGTVLTAQYVIGADGPESLVGRRAGITRVLSRRDAFTSAQYRVHSDFHNDGSIHFFIGRRHIPGGYIWVFPKAPGLISVGAGYFGCPQGQPSAYRALERFIDTHIPGAKRTDLITGCVPLALCPRRLSRGNVLVVGDAARQANPLTAGGIMNTLEAADDAVRDLLGSPGPDRAGEGYSRKWAGYHRRQQKFFYAAKELFLEASDEKIEKIVRMGAAVFRDVKIDRSRPFRFPPIPMARLILGVLPDFVRQWRVLVR